MAREDEYPQYEGIPEEQMPAVDDVEWDSLNGGDVTDPGV